jgi:hypothetical protein
MKRVDSSIFACSCAFPHLALALVLSDVALARALQYSFSRCPALPLMPSNVRFHAFKRPYLTRDSLSCAHYMIRYLSNSILCTLKRHALALQQLHLSLRDNLLSPLEYGLNLACKCRLNVTCPVLCSQRFSWIGSGRHLPLM